MARKLPWVLVAGMLIAMPAADIDASAQQTPTYEVATIKPLGPNEYTLPLRIYVQRAFGIPANSAGWVIGPGWIDSARYVIQGKPAESMQKAMQTMTVEEKSKQVHLMMQALLADRFALKAHFETREMPVYELVVAKGGTKLKETTDLMHARVSVGAALIRGTGVPMHNLIDCLESVPDIGGRVVIDKTGLTGAYDILLKWTPLQAATPSDGLSGTAQSLNAEAASLFTAIDEQLGLKLVASKVPGQVLVIDHIERPSAN